jgi:hypothetical protein
MAICGGGSGAAVVGCGLVGAEEEWELDRMEEVEIW